MEHSSPIFIDSDVYLEPLAILLALALSWLLAYLLRKRAEVYCRTKTFKYVDSEALTRPLPLLFPLLTIMYLYVALLLVSGIGGGYLIAMALRLAVAYLVACGVLLIVRSKPVAYFIASIIMLLAVLRALGLMHGTLAYLRSVEFGIGHVKLSLLNLAHGGVILVVVFWLASTLSHTLETYLRRRSQLNYSTRELIGKFFKIFIYLTALMITLAAMGVDLTAFAVFGGALGVGIGLGLQKITANFMSGITLLLEKSIKLGDLIEVAGNTGWVRQLNIRYALIETQDGRELLVPNDELISTRVTNWTYSNELARVEIKITVEADADVKLAQKLMIEAARENPRCLKDPPPACYLNEFTDRGILFLLTFWIADIRDGRLGPQSEVMLATVEKFRANGIKIAVAK